MTREFMARYEKELVAWGRGEEVEWQLEGGEAWSRLSSAENFSLCRLKLRINPKPREFWLAVYKDKSGDSFATEAEAITHATMEMEVIKVLEQL